MLFEDGTGYCPWHEKDSSFRIVANIDYAGPTFYSIHGGETRNAFEHEKEINRAVRTGVIVMECMHCKKTVILIETALRLPPDAPGDESAIRTWRRMVSPRQSPRQLHEAAPEEVRSLFAEASTCEEAKAFRAAGVMYRAAVEELVKDQGATGPNLYQKIDSLKGTLSDELVEDLHEARMLGNDSIHERLTYSEEEVSDVAGLIEEAVLVLYVQPEQKRAMRDARKARRSGKP